MDVSLAALQFGHFVASGHVPQTNRIVLAAGGQTRAVRAEGDRINDAAVRQRIERLERVGIPEPDRAVAGCRGEETAILAEGDGGNRVAMAGQDSKRFAGGGIPDSDGPVKASGDEAPSVGSKANSKDAVGMADQGAQCLTASGVERCTLQSPPSPGSVFPSATASARRPD